MLKDFLELDYKSPGSAERQKELFKGLEIMEDEEFCSKHMGQHPVVYLPFKELEGFMDTRQLLEEGNDVFMTMAFVELAQWLFRHCKREVAVIVDDYDAPLNQAHALGFDEEFKYRFGGMLAFLKYEHSPCPFFGIWLAGEHEAAKRALEEQANNFLPNTVLSQNLDFTDIFGFTRDEAAGLLKRLNLEDRLEDLRSLCGGYRWGRGEILSTSGTMRYLTTAKAQGNGAIQGALPDASPAGKAPAPAAQGSVAEPLPATLPAASCPDEDAKAREAAFRRRARNLCEWRSAQVQDLMGN